MQASLRKPSIRPPIARASDGRQISACPYRIPIGGSCRSRGRNRPSSCRSPPPGGLSHPRFGGRSAEDSGTRRSISLLRRAAGGNKMRIDQVREIARKHGIYTARMAKADIVRAIQRAEGNFDCFGSAVNGFFLRTRGGKGCSPYCLAQEVPVEGDHHPLSSFSLPPSIASPESGLPVRRPAGGAAPLNPGGQR